MIVGFTGSRNGMTAIQNTSVWELLVQLKPKEAHHGDCLGADEEFHDMCLDFNIPVVLHPPEDERWRAFCEGALRIEEPKPYLVRNKIIVGISGLLIAAPKEIEEPDIERGQGTWSTVRYARKIDRRFRIVWPE